MVALLGRISVICGNICIILSIMELVLDLDVYETSDDINAVVQIS